jgi:phage repressor protein C with HTH and peptisase S24 domain
MEPTIAELVKKRREELEMSQHLLAKAAGTSQATIDKIENGRSQNSRFLPHVFDALDLPLELLVPARGSGRTHEPDFVMMDGQQRLMAIEAKSIPGSQLVGDADLPIYSAVRGGSFGDAVVFSHEAIDYVKRPEPLRKARNGYGLYVVGESMEPAYRQGDLALIHPNLPPKAGDDVVVCSVDKNGEFSAVIKQLRRTTAEKWHLHQYNPPPGEEADFTLDRDTWPICHLVVGNYRRR